MLFVILLLLACRVFKAGVGGPVLCGALQDTGGEIVLLRDGLATRNGAAMCGGALFSVFCVGYLVCLATWFVSAVCLLGVSGSSVPPVLGGLCGPFVLRGVSGLYGHVVCRDCLFSLGCLDRGS